MTNEQIDELKKLVCGYRKPLKYDDDLDAYDRFGNADDAFYAGEENGERLLAEQVRRICGFDD